jgi:HAD superfamily hydrolase (TIGR01509 family)
MPFDLVIFDCDGVLVDSEALSNQAVAGVLARHGIPMTPQEAARRFTGLSNDAIRALLEREHAITLPGGFVDEIVEAEHHAMSTGDLHPIPGAPEVVRAVMAAGLAACVASNGEVEKMRASLGRTGLLPLFGDERLFSREHVVNGKPAPDVYLHAARRMGVQPERCAVVEDSPTGVRSGVSAGMRVFGYAPGGDPHGLGALGARPFERMGELPLLLLG